MASPGTSGHPVQQQGDQHARIAGVLPGQFNDSAQRRGQLGGRTPPAQTRPDSTSSAVAAPPLTNASKAPRTTMGSAMREFKVISTCASSSGTSCAGCGNGGAHGTEQLGGLGTGPEPAQRLKVGQRKDHFRLVVLILVIAVGGIAGNSGGFLVSESARGHAPGWGAPASDSALSAASSLARNGSLAPKAPWTSSPNVASGCCGNQLVQGHGPLRGGGNGGGIGVGAHPQLSLRARRLVPCPESSAMAVAEPHG